MYQRSFATLIRLKETINEVLDLRLTVKLFLEFVVLEIQTSIQALDHSYYQRFPTEFLDLEIVL